MRDRTIKSNSSEWRQYREIYQSSLWDFCVDIMGCADIDFPFFREECAIYDKNVKSGLRFQLRLFPRFHLKTSIYTIGGCLQDLCRDRNYTIAIISDTDEMAQDWLKVIANNILQNERLYFWFPEIRPTPEKRTEWNKRHITINRDVISPDPSIFACGITTNVVGKHPKKILFDDVVTFENTDTVAKIDKTRLCYEYLMSLPDPKTGRVEINGTRYAHDDLYSTLIKSGLYSIRERQVDELDASGNKVYIFPKKFDDESMRVLRAQQNAFIVSCQYYNRPIMHTDQLFQEEMFQEYEKLPEGGLYFISVDPASSTESSADSSAIVTCYWAPPSDASPLGAIYLCDYIHRRLKSDMLVEMMISKYVEVRPAAMSIEIAATFGGLWEFFWKECHTRGLGGINVLRFTPKPTQSKYERISMLVPWFNRKQIFMKKEHVDMRDQLMSYTGYKKKEKDDLIDAFSQQLFIGKVPDVVMETEDSDDYEPLFEQTAF